MAGRLLAGTAGRMERSDLPQSLSTGPTTGVRSVPLVFLVLLSLGGALERLMASHLNSLKGM